MPKTVDEFKQAFKALKKPKAPNKGLGKMKELLDKAVGDEDKEDFVKHIDVILKANRDYLVDLVAYKYAKHFDNADKQPYWHDKVPKDVLDEAFSRIVPDDISSTLTQRALERAALANNRSTVALIRARDPEGTQRFALDKMASLSGKGSKALRTALAGTLNFATVQETGTAMKGVLKSALTQGNGEAALEFGQNMGMMADQDILEIAATNPALFFKAAAQGFKDQGTKFVELFSKKAVRDQLADLDEAAWEEFVAATPMLATLVSVEKKVEEDGLTTSAQIMDAMFDAVLDPELMPMQYSATAVDSNETVKTGFTETSLGLRAQQKERGIINVMPKTAATDCHHMLYVTGDLMKMYPGLAPVIHNVNAPEMLMTKPLATIPGRGTLDRSFPGNVFNDAGKATGRVLFTGDDQGKNSHTWLSVDGAYFDPVMGTKGDQVRAAVEYEPTWVIPKRLANCHNGGWYAVMDPKLKPASNSMGFSTGYRLTQDPRRYLSDEEIDRAAL